MKDTKNAGAISTTIRKASAAAAIVAIFLMGCNLQFGALPETSWTESVPESFDFATSRIVAVDLDISVRTDGGIHPYEGDVGVYEFLDDGSYTLLGRGRADDAGKAGFPIVVPTATRSVNIRPSTLGLFNRDVELDPASPTLSLTISPDDEAPARSPAVESRALAATNAGFKVISSFDSQGVPAALDAPRPAVALPLVFLDDISASLPEYMPVPTYNPEYIDAGAKANLTLVEDAEVAVTFIGEGAGYKNVLGYFVFETAAGAPSSAPAPSSIVVIFPNVSQSGSGGGMKAGDRIKLLNPADGGTLFRKGTTIAWVLIANGFNGQINQGQASYYSVPALNPEAGSAAQKSHAVFLYYDHPDRLAEPAFILGFEDLNRATGDNDFNDAVFSVTANPPEAVDTSEIVQAKTAKDSDGDGVPDGADEYPDDPLRAASRSWPSATAYATALFEDRWPSLGDYDFNDIVVNLRVTTVEDAAGGAVELVVDGKLRAAGGGLPSGLGLSMPVPATMVSSVTGQSLSTGLFSPGANGVESDGSGSVVPIYSDGHREFGAAGGDSLLVNTVRGGEARAAVSFRVVVAFAPGVAATSLTLLPDVFAVVGGDRTREVHAIGKLPGGKANHALFGTMDDGSPSGGPYYRSKKGAPWALLVPAEIPWPIERAEISAAYSKYSSWVRSGGAQYADWYQDKANYRNTASLY